MANDIREKIVEKTIYVKKCETCGNDFEITKDGYDIRNRTACGFIISDKTNCFDCAKKNREKKQELAEQEAEKIFQEENAKYIGAKVCKITRGFDKKVLYVQIATSDGKFCTIAKESYDADECSLSISEA